MVVGRRGDRDGIPVGVEVAVIVVVVAAEPVGAGEEVGLGVGVLAAVGRARVSAASLLGSNPLGTEPSVVVKRYTSGALAFQGSCMTICKLSNIFNSKLSGMICAIHNF